MVERTEGGRHIIVDGRKWRATDPSIPEDLRQLFVDELMAARRAVRDADDDDQRRRARDRVQAAKVALGERGPKWWEHASDDDVKTRVDAARSALMRQLADQDNVDALVQQFRDAIRTGSDQQ